jgi:hypothetical protein
VHARSALTGEKPCTKYSDVHGTCRFSGMGTAVAVVAVDRSHRTPPIAYLLSLALLPAVNNAAQREDAHEASSTSSTRPTPPAHTNQCCARGAQRPSASAGAAEQLGITQIPAAREARSQQDVTLSKTCANYQNASCDDWLPSTHPSVANLPSLA